MHCEFNTPSVTLKFIEGIGPDYDFTQATYQTLNLPIFKVSEANLFCVTRGDSVRYTDLSILADDSPYNCGNICPNAVREPAVRQLRVFRNPIGAGRTLQLGEVSGELSAYDAGGKLLGRSRVVDGRPLTDVLRRARGVVYLRVAGMDGQRYVARVVRL